MRAREFNKRVEIWTVSSDYDGYGGYVTESAIQTSRWAKIESLRNVNYTDLGLDQNKLSMKFTMRKPTFNLDPTNNFIKYNSENWNIVSFPENKDFDNRYVTFIATKSD